jgi:hypothetical protein
VYFTLANITPTHLLSDVEGWHTIIITSREGKGFAAGIGCNISSPDTGHITQYFTILKEPVLRNVLCGLYGTFQ